MFWALLNKHSNESIYLTYKVVVIKKKNYLKDYSLNITDLPAGHFYFCSCINGVDLTVSKIFERIHIVSNSLKNTKYGSEI